MVKTDDWEKKKKKKNKGQKKKKKKKKKKPQTFYNSSGGREKIWDFFFFFRISVLQIKMKFFGSLLAPLEATYFPYFCEASKIQTFYVNRIVFSHL